MIENNKAMSNKWFLRSTKEKYDFYHHSNRAIMTNSSLHTMDFTSHVPHLTWTIPRTLVPSMRHPWWWTDYRWHSCPLVHIDWLETIAYLLAEKRGTPAPRRRMPLLSLWLSWSHWRHSQPCLTELSVRRITLE